MSETEHHNTTVEVIVAEEQQEPSKSSKPTSPEKLPLTRPVLSRSQRDAIVRSLTDPALGTRAQFPRISGDKNSEGRKRSSPNTERIRSMQMQEATSQTANQMPEVPRQERDAVQKAESTFNTKEALKFSGFIVATIGVASVLVGGIQLGTRALAKKWGLLTPQDG